MVLAHPPHPPHPHELAEPVIAMPHWPGDLDEWRRHRAHVGHPLRLRVPTGRADAGEVSVLVTVGDNPPAPIDACVILELTFGWGATSDSGVTTSADAGAGTLRLVDPLRLYDPTNAESTFAGVGTTIRVTLNGLPAFRGRVDDVQHDLEIATIALTDSVASLAAVQFVETSVPAETASARITRILDLASWPADRRDIGGGGVALQAGTVAADAWSELLDVTRNELGALWLTGEGRVAWRNRATAWAGGAPLLTFGCPPSDAFIGELTTRADQSNLVNVLSAARATGTQATVSDDDSVLLYGRKSHVQNDLQVATDGERDLWASFYLTRQANPAVGVAGFTTRPDAPTLSKILALTPGQLVRVFDEHHGPVIDRLARWLGARYAITPGYIEVSAVTGEDASIRQVARHRRIDTGVEWAALPTQGTALNLTAREPGLQLTTIPKRPTV